VKSDSAVTSERRELKQKPSNQFFEMTESLKPSFVVYSCSLEKASHNFVEAHSSKYSGISIPQFKVLVRKLNLDLEF